MFSALYGDTHDRQGNSNYGQPEARRMLATGDDIGSRAIYALLWFAGPRHCLQPPGRERPKLHGACTRLIHLVERFGEIAQNEG